MQNRLENLRSVLIEIRRSSGDSMHSYADSREGVKKFMKNEIRGYRSNSAFNDIEMAPDPHTQGVWMAVDHKKKRAFIIYLQGEGSFMGGPGEPDFEEIDYKSAVRQLNRLR